MFKDFLYCTKCDKYYTKKHRCIDPTLILIFRATRHIVDRLKVLGFKVYCTRIVRDEDWTDRTSYRTRIEIIFKSSYAECLLDELPDGWLWCNETLSVTYPNPASSLVHVAYTKYSSPIEGRSERAYNQAIASLEKYLNARNEEGIKAAMLLMYD